MSYCASCGSAMASGAVFCGSCGHRVGTPVPPAPAPVAPAPVAPTSVAPVIPTVAVGPTPTPPPPPAPRRGALVPVMVVLAVLAMGIGIVVLATRGDDSKSSAGTTTTTAALESTTTAVADSTTAVSSTVPPTTAAPDPSVQLQQLVAGDLPTAQSLVGKYVPQLSAKRVGLTVGGITYGPSEILDDHLKLRAPFGAILVDAGAFQFTSGGQPMTGWFLTIVPKAFATKAAATQWCTDQGMSPSDCFGRMFSPPK